MTTLTITIPLHFDSEMATLFRYYNFFIATQICVAIDKVTLKISHNLKP